MTDESNGEGAAPAEDTAAALDAEFNPKPETPDTPADDAGAEPEDKAEKPAKPEPKPKQTAQERIAELTWEKHELRRQNAELLDRLGKSNTPAKEPQPSTPQGDGKPDPSEFDGGIYDPEYLEALTDWKADQAVKRHTSQATEQQTQRAAVQAFESRVKQAFPEGEPEGLQAIRTMDTLPIALQDIMLESEIGPQLADHYGSKPAELARLSALPLPLQAREIALVEARLSQPVEPAKPQPKTQTEAPEPPPRARGSSGQFKVSPDTDDFAAFEKQYGV